MTNKGELLWLGAMIEKAQSLYPQFFENGVFKKPERLLRDSNAKTIKGEKLGWKTFILYMAPTNVSGLTNVCPWASQGCRAACLYDAGRGRFDKVKLGRLRKTVYFLLYRDEFIQQIHSEISKLKKKYEKIAIRLNGTSDIAYENIKTIFGLNIFQANPDVQFYDYTKGLHRLYKNKQRNYDLTFSRTENTPWETVGKLVSSGYRVAAVFGVNRSKKLPSKYKGIKVIDGDISDLRFLEKSGIVGLRFKKVKGEQNNFVIKCK